MELEPGPGSSPPRAVCTARRPGQRHPEPGPRTPCWGLGRHPVGLTKRHARGAGLGRVPLDYSRGARRSPWSAALDGRLTGRSREAGTPGIRVYLSRLLLRWTGAWGPERAGPAGGAEGYTRPAGLAGRAARSALPGAGQGAGTPRVHRGERPGAACWARPPPGWSVDWPEQMRAFVYTRVGGQGWGLGGSALSPCHDLSPEPGSGCPKEG